MKRSFETVLAEQCAPSLLGLKPASLFRWTDGAQTGRALTRHWRGILAPYGIGLRVLKASGADCLIYLYRDASLREILRDDGNRAFLCACGYDVSGGYAGVLRELSRRLCAGGGFPHEIGVLLGYPLEDVVGFIENGGGNCACHGCWKVYGDPEAARERFRRYHACTRACQERVRHGASITSLIPTA